MDYKTFVKEHISTVKGATQKDKMKAVAKLWAKYKKDNGIKTTSKPRPKSKSKTKTKLDRQHDSDSDDESVEGGVVGKLVHQAEGEGFFGDLIKSAVSKYVTPENLVKGISYLTGIKKPPSASLELAKQLVNNYPYVPKSTQPVVTPTPQVNFTPTVQPTSTSQNNRGGVIEEPVPEDYQPGSLKMIMAQIEADRRNNELIREMNKLREIEDEEDLRERVALQKEHNARMKELEPKPLSKFPAKKRAKGGEIIPPERARRMIEEASHDYIMETAKQRKAHKKRMEDLENELMRGAGWFDDLKRGFMMPINLAKDILGLSPEQEEQPEEPRVKRYQTDEEFLAKQDELNHNTMKTARENEQKMRQYKKQALKEKLDNEYSEAKKKLHK